LISRYAQPRLEIGKSGNGLRLLIPHILVVDHEAGSRAFLSRLLERAGFDSEQADSCRDALDSARKSRPQLVLVDVRLPDGSGFEVCRELRDLYGEELPIIFLSRERTQPFDRAAGLLLGGDDYVVKPFDPDELLARIRRCLVRVGAADRAATGENGSLPLTRREVEVLGLLAQGNDPETIAARLVISPKTVASHLQRVMAKLGVHSRVHAVARAYQMGIIRIREDATAARDVELHGSRVPRRARPLTPRTVTR
jgi:DNA-binding response OmpR family regulator